MVLANPNPGGAAFPSLSFLTEPLPSSHPPIFAPLPISAPLRQGDIMALGRVVHIMDSAMDIAIASGQTKSCLHSSCKSSDYVMKVVEVAKFGKDKRYCNPIAAASTMRFVPYVGTKPLGSKSTSLPRCSRGICHNIGH